MSSSSDSPKHRYFAEILLASCAALLLEVSYTRLVSFKLYYYFTYLIIGFAMLGMGSGAVVVALSRRLRATPLERLVARCCLASSLLVAAGYLVIARLPLDSSALWTTWREPLRMTVLCAALYATFAPIGVLVATLFSRRPRDISRLYFADLLGAGLGCAAVVPLLVVLTPPGCIALAGALLALLAARLAVRQSTGLLAVAGAAALGLGVFAAFPQALPQPVPDTSIKTVDPDITLFSRWHPVFRIDVTNYHDADDSVREIHHDGLWGSTLHRFDGDVASLGRFERDARSLPFKTQGRPLRDVLIIGAAGGHEILAALHFDAQRITGVELNPVTVSLLTDVFADYTGRLAEHPRVEIEADDGRSFLARQRGREFDLIYFVAPDSYTAMNAATAGAYVLAESYLFTVEMIELALDHLRDDGILSMQFGEFFYETKPNRTARYVGTTREAFRRRGIDDFPRHVLVATTESFLELSTVLIGKAPFGAGEVERFVGAVGKVPASRLRHVPGRRLDRGAVNRVIELPDAALELFYERNLWDVSPITDDAPFFWHFVRFQTVLYGLGQPFRPIEADDSLGERVILLMFGVSALFAAVFLLLPFVTIGRRWRRLPSKLRTGFYFGALGLGFMSFEICLIQKLTLLLGYPTYSLTLTLAGLLVFSGLGSLQSERYAGRRDRAMLGLLAVLGLLTVFYQAGLPLLVEVLLPQPLALRAAVVLVAIAPLGLVLGAFMPLGLRAVAGLAADAGDYVAWGWAVNGFASVIGSVGATILSMMHGFDFVLALGLGVYALAVLCLRGFGDASLG